MGGKGSKSIPVRATAGTTEKTTTASTSSCPNRCRVENYFVVWVDGNIDPTNADCKNTLTQLRSIVNEVNMCTTKDECIRWLNENREETAFVISSGALGQSLVPEIHDMTKLGAIYIFCGNKKRHEEWGENWSKIKGIHTSITPICAALKQAIEQCSQDNMSVSIISVHEGNSDQNLNEIEPTFMYSQIFKEILLEMTHNETALEELAEFCKKQYQGNDREMKTIDEFQHKYVASKAIWWYTRECFTYKMLNRALRVLDGDIIIRMGFFLCDVHRQIEYLYNKQVSQYKGEPFHVHRGQALSTSDFSKLTSNMGGLISFNNFLSTSSKREVSIRFAKRVFLTDNTVGIIFNMTIDPKISTAPFASIQEVSYFQTEYEILFSMHTIFRIGEARRIDRKALIYEVDLTLTADNDEQLDKLAKHIRTDTSGKTGWRRLGHLLSRMGQLEKTDELYTMLLEQALDESDQAYYYNQLGCIKIRQGKYREALEFYEKSLKIDEKALPPNHPSLATSYNNIAGVYKDKGDYSKALELYEKSLEIREKALSSNHPDLATSYNNIGQVYNKMGDFSKALEIYEKSLKIREKTLPSNHPDLATSYNNIGQVYNKMGDYSKALELYEKSLKIREKALPSNHPSLATSYHNIAGVYKDKGDYTKALEFYEKSLKIDEKALPPNHPSLATSYHNVAGVYKDKGDYTKALEFYEKSLKIDENALPPDHPSLATFYQKIAGMYKKNGNYSKALEFYEKSLKINEKAKSPNHSDSAHSCRNIARMHKKMGNHSKALEFYEKSLEIYENSLPATHPHINSARNNIAALKKKI